MRSIISINKLIKKIEEITEKEVRIKYIEKQKEDIRDTLADTSKISNELNWKPEIKVEEGLKRFVRWYKNYKN